MAEASTERVLELKLVHQRAIPSLWNQIKLETFPCNWLVLGFVEGSTTDLQVLGEGPGGLLDAVTYIRSDQVQYLGFRVSRSGASKPALVLLRWVGNHTSSLQCKHLDADIEFLKGYFQDATNVICVHQEDLAHGCDELENDLVEFVAEVLQTCGIEDGSGDGALDFRNSSAVHECTHYNTKEPGFEDSDGMDTDALFNAMKAFEAEEAAAKEKEGQAYDPDFSDRRAFPVYGSADDPNVKNMLREETEEKDDGIPPAPSTGERHYNNYIPSSDVAALTKEAQETATAARVPSFASEMKRAVTSHSDIDEMIQKAKKTSADMRSLEMERIKLTQERLFMHQEQAAAALEKKRLETKDRLAKRLANRLAKRRAAGGGGD